MPDALYWIGVVLAVALIGLGLYAFWRGLSLPPNDPMPPPGKGRFWRT
jgi:uncharacterized membrane protein